MSMSKKLTFSLASLVVLFGLVFVPAMAQAQEAVPVETEPLSGSIAPKSYMVIARTATMADNGLPTGVTPVVWGDMPDLQKLFRFEGGTLLLKATKTAFTDATPPVLEGIDYRLDRDGDDIYRLSDYGLDGLLATASTDDGGDGIKDSAQKTYAALTGDARDAATMPTDVTDPASAEEDAKIRDLIITEVMWGRDEFTIGAAGGTSHQWIEIYNNLNAPFPLDGVSLVAKSGRTGVPAAAATETEMDRLSNVGTTPWTFNIGQDGSTSTDAPKDFISIHRSDRGKAGDDATAWKASEEIYFRNHRGTPGAGEAPGVKTFDPSAVSLSVVFNEVANRTGDKKYEWIELLIKSGDPHFENWKVSAVKAVDDEVVIFTLPKLDKSRYDNILLITATDPALDSDHPLAAGYNVASADADQDGEGRDSSIRYFVPTWENELPDSEFVLILRSNKDKTNHETVVDIAGNHSDLSSRTADFSSDLWPLIGYAAPDKTNNGLAEETVQQRQFNDIVGTGTKDADKEDKVAFRERGWTGIGYKRNAEQGAATGGTPGYPNDAVKDRDAVATGSLLISEIMYDVGARNLPQWIELYNTSDTIGVSLNGWKLKVVNHGDMHDGAPFVAGKLSEEFNLDNVVIPPKQIYLIVARRSSINETKLPSSRIQNLGKKRTEMLLNPYGFELTITAKEGADKEADKVGNLGIAAEGNNRADAQSFEATTWALPAGLDDSGNRVSIVRMLGKGIPGAGTTAADWAPFDMAQIDLIRDPTSYGHSSDVASPGHTVGGVLPVSLSKFRPERMKDTGEIVVRWITQSETNNAGFNILRSETRDGEFTKLNTKLIAGQGTTSERTVYEFADPSAKPNVVYYYQIQDVSLDGQVTPLAITHLRGNVTAAGKLTTTWGELKLQD